MKLTDDQQELFAVLHRSVRARRGDPPLIVLSGDTGSGKSMLLRVFARSLSITHLHSLNTSGLLAITMPLQDLQTPPTNDLWQAILTAWVVWANEVSESTAFSPAWVEKRLASKPTVLLLDSVDEFLMNHPRLRPEELRRMLFNLRRRFRENTNLSLVLGIRSSEPILHQLAEDADHDLEIRNLTEAEARKYFPMAAPAIDRVRHQPQLLEILLSPLLLDALSGMVVEDLADRALETASDIVDLAITVLIKESHLTYLSSASPNSTEESQTTVTDWKNALTLLALMYSARNVAEMSHNSIIEEASCMRDLWKEHVWPVERNLLADKLTRGFDTITSDKTMRPLMTRSLFFPTRSGAYRFKHRQWQDFLFGRYLAISIEAENLKELMRGAFHSRAMRTAGEILVSQKWTGVSPGLIQQLAERMVQPKGQWAFGNFGGLLGNSILPIEPPALELLVASYQSMPKAGLMTFLGATGTRIIRHDPQDRSWEVLFRGLERLMRNAIATVADAATAEGHERVTASISWCFLADFGRRFGQQHSSGVVWPGLNLSAEQEQQALDQLLAERVSGQFMFPPAADYQTVQSAYLALVQHAVAQADAPRTNSAVHYLYMLSLALKYGVAIDDVRDALPALLQPRSAAARMFAQVPEQAVHHVFEAARLAAVGDNT